MALFKRKKADTDKEKDTGSQQDGGKQQEASMKDLYASEEKKKGAKKSGEDAGAKKASSKQKGTGAKEKKGKTPRIAYRVIIKPLVTEKVGELSKENKYVFQVANNANKIEVAKAIEEVYNVRPEKVNMIRMQGKRVRFGRLEGKRSNWKKAIVKLPKGKSISLHEGV